MSKPYFRHVPNLEYVNRNRDENTISNYVEVKNLFKRGKIRDDIFQNIMFFDKYTIMSDERPDNVAFNVYGNSDLDWVILLSNNILNIQSEWPLTQRVFDKVMLEKYGSYENLYSIHHYESKEVKDLSGFTLIPEGVVVPENFTLVYYDQSLGSENVISDIAIPITNYDYEMKLEDKKRNIYVLKPRHLSLVFNDLEKIMTYKKGSTQYVSRTLKRGDNIRLYE